MSRRVVQRRDMGDAISLEDALSVMVVIFVLFVLIMVPLINIDKIRLAKAEKDQTYLNRALWLTEQPQSDAALNAYRATFSLHQEGFSFKGKVAPYTYIEFFSPEDSTLTVIRHNIEQGHYTLMQSIGLGADAVFREGRLVWSPDEGEWFTAADKLISSKSAPAKNMKDKYKSWIEKGREIQ